MKMNNNTSKENSEKKVSQLLHNSITEIETFDIIRPVQNDMISTNRNNTFIIITKRVRIP